RRGLARHDLWGGGAATPARERVLAAERMPGPGDPAGGDHSVCHPLRYRGRSNRVAECLFARHGYAVVEPDAAQPGGCGAVAVEVGTVHDPLAVTPWRNGQRENSTGCRLRLDLTVQGQHAHPPGGIGNED